MSTPTQAVLATAISTVMVKDKAGRCFLLRRPNALDTLRLFKAAGPVLAQNEPWLTMASLACSVREIEGIPIPTPTTETQIEALVERLGDDGLAAIAEEFDTKMPDGQVETNVGNSLGIPS